MPLWNTSNALAGFLFGFDTVVISGAEQAIQSLWNLSPAMHGMVMGSALYGTLLGAVVGAWLIDQLGRRKTLIFAFIASHAMTLQFLLVYLSVPETKGVPLEEMQARL